MNVKATNDVDRLVRSLANLIGSSNLDIVENGLRDMVSFCLQDADWTPRERAMQERMEDLQTEIRELQGKVDDRRLQSHIFAIMKDTTCWTARERDMLEKMEEMHLRIKALEEQLPRTKEAEAEPVESNPSLPTHLPQDSDTEMAGITAATTQTSLEPQHNRFRSPVSPNVIAANGAVGNEPVTTQSLQSRSEADEPMLRRLELEAVDPSPTQHLHNARNSSMLADLVDVGKTLVEQEKAVPPPAIIIVPTPRTPQEEDAPLLPIGISALQARSKSRSTTPTNLNASAEDVFISHSPRFHSSYLLNTDDELEW